MGLSRVQKLAWAYSALFLFVVILGYIPGVEDSEGLMFGLFKIDFIDDMLHLASAVWAGFAAWHSIGFAIFYFRWFGLLYLLDGVVGSFVGKGLLDFGIFLGGHGIEDQLTRVLANIPHIAIGGMAVIIGFYLSKKWHSEA